MLAPEICAVSMRTCANRRLSRPVLYMKELHRGWVGDGLHAESHGKPAGGPADLCPPPQSPRREDSARRDSPRRRSKSRSHSRERRRASRSPPPRSRSPPRRSRSRSRGRYRSRSRDRGYGRGNDRRRCVAQLREGLRDRRTEPIGYSVADRHSVAGPASPGRQPSRPPLLQVARLPPPLSLA